MATERAGHERALAGRRWRVDVVVLPKTGVNDPEGEAILGGLHGLGYGLVGRVRAGRFFRLELAAESAEQAEGAVREMCDRLLANPVIESYRIDAVGPATEVEV